MKENRLERKHNESKYDPRKRTKRVRVISWIVILPLAVILFPAYVSTSTVKKLRSQPPLTTAFVGVTLIDGSGRRRIPNSTVIIGGDSILSVGQTGRITIPPGARVVDARGLVVAPGFIDTHNHSDRGLDSEPSAASQVSQGITTIAVGQDGSSAFPIGAYLDKLEANPVSLNVLTFVGHATLRSRVMGENTNRHATQSEIQQMQQMVDEAMRDGAFGLSTGLEYEIGKPATTEEVIALASVAGKHQGIYISHIRDEADKAFEAFREALRIGQEGHLPVQISHIKLGTVAVWGRAKEAVALITNARIRGQDVSADCYPYDAWNSTIRVLIPSGNYENPTDVARGLADVGGAENITIVSCRVHPDYEFKTLADIASSERTTAVDLYMKIVSDGGASIVCRSMKESDIRVFYQQPWVMVSSDGGIGSRHPRGAGTFPRVLGRFVRERRWLSLEEAIRKMTSLPAARLRLADRGLIREGMKADLVLFDPEVVVDRSTFAQPGTLSDGIKHVFVNGVEVWRENAVTGARPGRPLRRG